MVDVLRAEGGGGSFSEEDGCELDNESHEGFRSRTRRDGTQNLKKWVMSTYTSLDNNCTLS
jgi:hypothetical protein